MKEERTGDKMKEIKYLCLVNTVTPGIKDTLKEVPARSGFYNWLFAFKGDIASYENVVDGTVNLHDYDVVHINLPPIDQVMIFDIRKRLGWNSKTKLVLNNDYVLKCFFPTVFKYNHPLNFNINFKSFSSLINNYSISLIIIIT